MSNKPETIPPQSDTKIFGGGGGSGKTGYDVALGVQTKLWESQNKSTSIHGTATYAQHLGGPYGNSKPNYGGGIGVRFNF
ncbi:diptericin-D-like [Condylostylus longicornis]|uniref:diptericin-D-like n=1 Tax=Condylostylus longicornis TaxID=2530218 RepID=UPI00244E490D|nr:diptericin-D-like [Condylostylus longicornis]